MKAAIWILFVFLATAWTLLAWGVSGLAGWASEAIASERAAQAARPLVQSGADAARAALNSLTQATEKAVDQANAAAAQAGAASQPAADAAALALQKSLEAAKTAADKAGEAMAKAPPLPAWVDQWLGPEWAQWMKDQVKQSAAIAGSGSLAAQESTQAAIDAAAKALAASGDANEAARAATEAIKRSADSLSAQAGAHAGALPTVAPWLGKAIGWLVPIVWVLWGIGLVVGLLVTIVLQWMVGLMFSRPPAVAPAGT